MTLNSEFVVASRNRRKFRDGLTEVIPMQVSDRHQPWSTHGSTGSTPALPQLTCVDHVKRVTPVQLYLYINLYNNGNVDTQYII